MLIDILHVDVVIDSDDETLLMHTPLSTSDQGLIDYVRELDTQHSNFYQSIHFVLRSNITVQL